MWSKPQGGGLLAPISADTIRGTYSRVSHMEKDQVRHKQEVPRSDVFPLSPLWKHKKYILLSIRYVTLVCLCRSPLNFRLWVNNDSGRSQPFCHPWLPFSNKRLQTGLIVLPFYSTLHERFCLDLKMVLFLSESICNCSQCSRGTHRGSNQRLGSQCETAPYVPLYAARAGDNATK